MGAVKKLVGGAAPLVGAGVGMLAGGPGGAITGMQVGSAISGALGSGGKTTTGSQSGQFQNTQTSTRTLGRATAEEELLARQQFGQLGQMTGQFGEQYGQASEDYARTAAMFRDALTRFATGSLQPSPEQLAQATSFVDQTFTAPAEQQYGKFLSQAQEATAQRAAALGRTSLDSAINQQFVGQASDVAQQLANQRAGLIAQRADELAYARPQQQLNALGQGAQFFNQPLQQAISNRLALLNAGTAQQQLGLERQLQTGTTSTTQGGTSSGTVSQTVPGASLGTRLSGLGSQLSDLYRAGGFGGGSTSGGGLPISPANPSSGGFNLGNFKLNY